MKSASPWLISLALNGLVAGAMFFSLARARPLPGPAGPLYRVDVAPGSTAVAAGRSQNGASSAIANGRSHKEAPGHAEKVGARPGGSRASTPRVLHQGVGPRTTGAPPEPGAAGQNSRRPRPAPIARGTAPHSGGTGPAVGGQVSGSSGSGPGVDSGEAQVGGPGSGFGAAGAETGPSGGGDNGGSPGLEGGPAAGGPASAPEPDPLPTAIPTPRPTPTPAPTPQPTRVPTPEPTATPRPTPVPTPTPRPEPTPEPTRAPSGPTRSAELVRQVNPRIPSHLREKEFAASVPVRIEIGADGSASPVLRGSSGIAELDQRVLDAVRRWRFKPALQGGQPVASSRNFRVDLSVR